MLIPGMHRLLCTFLKAYTLFVGIIIDAKKCIFRLLFVHVNFRQIIIFKIYAIDLLRIFNHTIHNTFCIPKKIIMNLFLSLFWNHFLKFYAALHQNFQMIIIFFQFS